VKKHPNDAISRETHNHAAQVRTNAGTETLCLTDGGGADGLGAAPQRRSQPAHQSADQPGGAGAGAFKDELVTAKTRLQLRIAAAVDR
jgi:hypothetical protein